MNFIFNRLSFVHGGATLLAALTLGLACLFCGFNAGADNDDEHNEFAEQSEQEGARENTKTADNNDVIRELRHSVELMQKAGISAASIMMRLPNQNVMVQSEADVSAADMMRRPDQNAAVQQK